MAKKLTNDLIEKMVLDTLNESNDMNEILGAIKGFFGDRSPTQAPSQKGISGGSYKLPAGYGAVSDKDEILDFLVSTRSVPNHIKEKIIDLVMAVPSAKKSAIPSAPTGPAPMDPEVAAFQMNPEFEKDEDLPTSKTPGPMGKRNPAARPVYASGAKKGLGYYPEKESDDVPTAKLQKEPIKKVAEQKMIESIIAEVLEEMAKKGKKEPKKEDKQQPKKTGKK